MDDFDPFAFPDELAGVGVQAEQAIRIRGGSVDAAAVGERRAEVAVTRHRRPLVPPVAVLPGRLAVDRVEGDYRSAVGAVDDVRSGDGDEFMPIARVAVRLAPRLADDALPDQLRRRFQIVDAVAGNARHRVAGQLPPEPDVES